MTDNNETLSLDFDDAKLASVAEEEGLELFFGNRYIKAPECKEYPEEYMMYEKAEQLADAIILDRQARYNVIVSGNFIFGDFIEALVVKNNIKCRRLVISTLSMSDNNVDSLANLINAEYVDKLDLIVSDHFFSHERRGLIPYIYQELDKNDAFQLATAGVHTKICLIETEGGRHIVIHGSANLRSSSNVEQFVIEDNKGLFEFWLKYHDQIIEKYKTINKSIRGGELWRAVAVNGDNGVQQEVNPKQQNER